MTEFKILVIIPIFNESTSLPMVIRELKLQQGFEVLVVDDGSTDDSVSVARALGIKVLPLRIRLGAWGAMQTGIRFALRNRYTHVITMDGDGQHHASEIPNLIETMKNNSSVDVVIGACVERGSRLRKFAWKFFRKITGVGVEDITSGFRMYNSKAIQLLAKKEATLLDYQDIGVLLMLKSAGFKIMEITVAMTPRISGKSHVFSSWLVVIYYMVLSTILSVSKVKKPKKGAG